MVQQQQQPQQQKFGAIWYPHRKSSYWQADAAVAVHAVTDNVATIQPVESGSELRQVAQLRADAYYEVVHLCANCSTKSVCCCLLLMSASWNGPALWGPITRAGSNSSAQQSATP